MTTAPSSRLFERTTAPFRLGSPLSVSSLLSKHDRDVTTGRGEFSRLLLSLLRSSRGCASLHSRKSHRALPRALLRRFCAGREEWLSFVLFVVRGLMLFSALGNFIDPLSNACARRPHPLQPG